MTTRGGSWRDLGKWIVRDENRGLHGQSCKCHEPGAEYDSNCNGRVMIPFNTEADANAHARELETAQRVACQAYPLQIREG